MRPLNGQLRFALVAFLSAPLLAAAQSRPAGRGAAPATADSATSGISASALGGFRFRGIGPATYSGRIGDIAVHPDGRTWAVRERRTGFELRIGEGEDAVIRKRTSATPNAEVRRMLREQAAEGFLRKSE